MTRFINPPVGRVPVSVLNFCRIRLQQSAVEAEDTEARFGSTVHNHCWRLADFADARRGVNIRPQGMELFFEIVALE